MAWGIGAAAGGATNLIDRLRKGAVVDFIGVGWCPVFNLADAAIVVGAGLVILSMWTNMRRVPFRCCDLPIYNYPAMLYFGTVAGIFVGAHVARLSRPRFASICERDLDPIRTDTGRCQASVRAHALGHLRARYTTRVVPIGRRYGHLMSDQDAAIDLFLTSLARDRASARSY
jgi:hypothetical protein